jgi:hypothetical protein
MENDEKRYFNLKPLNIKNFIKVNKLEEITSPIFFTKNNSPDPNGLLSNEIFGIAKEQRANTFAYISLGKDPFMHPLMYKIWCKMDSKIKACVHGTSNFKINSSGELVEDEDGECGLLFLKKNLDKIKIKSTSSNKRENNIQFLKKYKDYIFIEDMAVIPAYYRDINSDGGYVGVGDINKLYNQLIIATKSLRESAEYGLTLANSVRGRIQEILVSIYDWFTSEPNIPGKRGILRRANLSKTTDYSSRLVLSAPNLKVERMDDMLTDLDHTAVPLASVCSNFFPYIIFYMRRFFENEFANEPIRTVFDKKDRKAKQYKMKDYQIAFSDTVLKEELDRFMHGYSNRFRPIMLPLENEKMQVALRFKGRNVTEKQFKDGNDILKFPIMERDFTWCDLIYIAAVEVTKDKTVLITRYPIDSCYNQFPTMIRVSSTKLTEPMVINNTFYQHYPKIRQEDIGKNTSNVFIDTANICNAYLGSIGGDYDGDQVSCKSVYSIEANEELRNQLNSKAHYISFGGNNIMETTNEGMQCLYNLTIILDGDQKRLSQPIF